jgi:hypothetical protein
MIDCEFPGGNIVVDAIEDQSSQSISASNG